MSYVSYVFVKDHLDPKEYSLTKYKKNKRHKKDIIRRMAKQEEKAEKLKHPERLYVTTNLEDGKETSRKLNNDKSSCYEKRQDRAWQRPNVCGCCWTMKKSRWYIRHHRDRSRKGINKDRQFYYFRSPSYCSKHYINNVISDGVSDLFI